MKRKIMLVMVLVTTLPVLLVMAQELDKLRVFSSMGDMWSLLHLNDDAPCWFSEVDSLDFPGPPIPSPGDSLLSIEGFPASRTHYFSVFNTRRAPGDTLSISFLHQGRALETRVVTRSIPFRYLALTLILFLLRLLLVMGFLAVAFLGLRKKGEVGATVRSLILFCLAMAANLSIASGNISQFYATFQIPREVFFLVQSIGVFAWAFLLKIALCFPRPHPWVKRRAPAWLIFLPPLLLVAKSYEAFLRFAPFENRPEPLIYSTAYILFALLLLRRSSRKLPDPLERRQARIVLLGALPGQVFATLLGFLLQADPTILNNVSFTTRLLLSNVLFLLVALLPASLFYAIGRYRLMALEVRIRRSTRFLGVNLLLLLTVAGILYIFAELVLSEMRITSQTPTLVLGVLLAMGFGPAQRRIRARLEERVFPERAKLRRLLREFLVSGITGAGADAFWKELGDRLAEGLGTRQVVPVLIREGSCLEILTGFEAPFHPGDGFLSDLSRHSQPLPLDEIRASGRFAMTPEQSLWFASHGAVLLIPLRPPEGLLGFVAVGGKTGGEEYTPDEMEILSALTGQMSLVVENLELLEERVRKENLELQMDLARTVQQRLLPLSLPSVPGCALACRLKPCMDVAGDYYDAFLIRDTDLLVAVGDVSGKGMGPALIMANLQAALRTALESGVDLHRAVAQINRMITGSIPDEMFITLFAGVYSPSRGTLSYVNAGHNPPLHVSAEGGTTLLGSGGLLLGVREDAAYTMDTILCRPGDTLLLYTDGVTEAMNPQEEEFGEDRLATLAVRKRHLPLDDLLTLIEQHVAEFRGSDTFPDDFTLVALRKI